MEQNFTEITLGTAIKEVDGASSFSKRLDTEPQMQTLQKQAFKGSTINRPVATYLDREIRLNRVAVGGVDRGLWLHWCDPRDLGQKDAVKYGYFMATEQSLQDALHEVYRMIEATVELEVTDAQQSNPAQLDFYPQSFRL